MKAKTENKNKNYDLDPVLLSLKQGDKWRTIPFGTLIIYFIISLLPHQNAKSILIKNFFSMTGISFICTHILISFIGTTADKLSKKIYEELTSENPDANTVSFLINQRRNKYTILVATILLIIFFIYAHNTIPSVFFKNFFSAIYNSDFKIIYAIYLFFAISGGAKTRKIFDTAANYLKKE